MIFFSFAACRWIGRNTPRKRVAVSETWRLVKRLKPGNPLSDVGHTHICVVEIHVNEFGGSICNQPLTLHKRHKGFGHSWITTRVVEHFAKVHKEALVSRQHVERANVAHTSKVNWQLTYSASDIVSSGGEKDIKGKKALTTIAQTTINSTILSRFKLTPQQRQLSSQAQWYVYLL